jgi:hypothetical protein
MKRGKYDMAWCVEQLCQAGCKRVYEYIDALRAGRRLTEIGPLTLSERESLLDELTSIMAVYDSGCKR